MRLEPGLENSDNSRFCTDLELVRQIYFAKNKFLSVRKIALFVYLSEFNFDRLLLFVIFFLFGPKNHTFSSEIHTFSGEIPYMSSCLLSLIGQLSHIGTMPKGTLVSIC